MSNEKKYTPGPWKTYRNDGVDAYNEFAGIGVCAWHDGQIHNDVAHCAIYGITDAEAEANASLIAEAGTVAHETGLTPRQLAEQRAELLEALEEVVEYHEGRGKYNFSKLPDEERANAAYDAWQDIWRKKIHPAIAKAIGE